MKDARPTLKTQRLTLRPFHLADAKRVQQLAGDPEIAKTTSNVPHPYKDGMAEDWISKHAEHFQRGFALTLAIENQHDLIGCISLIGDLKTRAELGYWIGKPYWNQGFCTEAARALAQFGFDQLHLHKIISRHFAINPASGKIMQKLGMKQEGVLREDIFKDGAWHDVIVYGLLRAELRIA